MTYLREWEEFERAAEHLYMKNPLKVRYVMKYVHSKNILLLKITDNVVCLQYKTDIQQDVRRIDKLINNLMRKMVTKDH